MPDPWSKKDARQFEHVKENVKARGAKDDLAKEIATHTVNQQRRIEGRTPDPTAEETAHPDLPLEERTRDELYRRARELGIPNRSRMSKGELVRAIRSRR